MEHKKKVVVKLPLSSALLLLEQLVLTTHVYSARVKAHCIVGCNDCRMRSIKTIKKALSSCCPELFDNEVQVELEIEYNDHVEMILQAFRSPRLGHIVEVQ